MSIKIMTEVWDHADVKSGYLTVLLKIADSADEKTRMAWPGIETLALKTRLTTRQVKNCIAALKNDGFISVQRNASPAKTNLYTIAPVSAWRTVDTTRGEIFSPPAEGKSFHPQEDTEFPSDGHSMSPKPSVTSVKPSEAPKKSITKKASQIPDDWAITQDQRDYATGKGFRGNVDLEAEKFKSHHQAKGTTFKDWNKAWQTWACKAVSYQRPNGRAEEPFKPQGWGRMDESERMELF